MNSGPSSTAPGESLTPLPMTMRSPSRWTPGGIGVSNRDVGSRRVARRARAEELPRPLGVEKAATRFRQRAKRGGRRRRRRSSSSLARVVRPHAVLTRLGPCELPPVVGERLLEPGVELDARRHAQGLGEPAVRQRAAPQLAAVLSA